MTKKEKQIKMMVDQMIKKGFYENEEDVIFDALRRLLHELSSGNLKSDLDMAMEVNEDYKNEIMMLKKGGN